MHILRSAAGRRAGRPALVAAVLAVTVAPAAEPPSAQLALSFKPAQKGVEYDVPQRSEYDKCKVQVERRGKTSGWVVLDPDGQVLRRFVDTNGDNVVDQWRYFQNGLEVYRDVDENFNNKVDQSRWLNSGGSRWAVDANEDGRIDRWKVLSAAEASREAATALIEGDAARLQTLLVTRDDLDQLGLEDDLKKQILDALADPGQRMRDIRSKSKTLTQNTKWMRFDAPPPGTIPADEGKADRDLFVYENAMAIVETDRSAALVQLGELVRVGEVWKLTQVPFPLEESMQIAVAGVLMQPGDPTQQTSIPGAITPEMQKLLTDLQELDRQSPQPSAAADALTRYNARRADILASLVQASQSDEDRQNWTRQLIDGLATAVQTGAWEPGLQRLRQLEADLSRPPGDELKGYAMYRRLLSQYSLDLQGAGGDPDARQKVQTWWLAQLASFVEEFPRAEDAPAALLQLAMAHEFAGNIDDARTWYSRVSEDHRDTDFGQRGAGAIRRLDLVGKPLRLSGPALDGGKVDSARYRGKALLVIYWTTWCKPCTEDLPQIRALYEKHRKDGFEIIGVNLDATTEPVQPYLSEHRVTWPQIHEPGGLDSGPGREFGIISVPTMFLVDTKGAVVSRATSVAEVKDKLPEILAVK